jgi:two-component system, chemotaxis family, CheB/CheR fusion protein
LESANEELTTLNEEMSNRNTELSRLNADLSNLHLSVNMAILVLARDLTIRRFTAPAEKIFNLLATDVGRPLSSVRHNLIVVDELASRGNDPRSSTTTENQSLITSAATIPFLLEDLLREVIDTVSVREREVRDKDGRWYVLRARPYMTADNKIDGAVLVLVDIDDLKRSEREAKAARDYAEATIRTARDPMIVLRADLRVNTANEAFYKTFKTTPDQTEGRLIYDLGDKQWNIPKLRMFLEDILSRNSFFDDFEVTHDFPQIGRRTMLLNARRLELDDGARQMVLLAIEDVTERQLQEALRENQAQLENKVAERTRELQQVNAALWRDMEERKKLEEQLLQAQKMESIGVLAGGIAHDFNNILNIIQGYAFVLRGHGTQDKEIGDSLTVIDETVHRGSALVQQLLTLARKSTTKVEAVDINGLVEGLIALITQTFPKTIELSRALEADLPPITADKNQIEQALLNLCVNARDAMSDGGRLSVKTELIEGATLQGLGKTLDGDYVCIEVSDTGVGMDESTRNRIFEPFFTTKNTGQGTGLGLSVVYGIVKNHNGFINVESKPQSGTSFRLYFPVAQSLEKSTTGEITEASFETTERPNGHGTILLVEDEKNMLDLLKKTLARHGYQVLAAADGETALNIYRRSKEAIDVVLLDIGLPKVAGGDVLLKLKNENPDVKVVIASGYLEPKLKSEMDRAGVKYFLQKPYRPDEVVRTLQSLIEGES